MAASGTKLFISILRISPISILFSNKSDFIIDWDDEDNSFG